METTISVTIPQGYWGIVKRWLGRVARAPELLGYPEPEVEVGKDGTILYRTFSRFGRYAIKANKNRTTLLISFAGRRNSFRSGTPFLGFHWVCYYRRNISITVILRDINPFAPEIHFLGWVEEYKTSAPEKLFPYDRSLIHVPAQTS